jgi:hypothetical protein
MEFTKENTEQIIREKRNWTEKVQKRDTEIKETFEELLFLKTIRDGDVRNYGYCRNPEINKRFREQFIKLNRYLVEVMQPDSTQQLNLKELVQ